MKLSQRLSATTRCMQCIRNGPMSPGGCRGGYTPSGAAAAVEDLPEGGLPPPQQQLGSRPSYIALCLKTGSGGSTNPAAAAEFRVPFVALCLKIY
jgi:hypothetical protein